MTMNQKIVFDFGGVLFNWHPVAMLQREVPHVAPNAAAAVHWVAQIFQGYGGDWGEFDAGRIGRSEAVARIARRTGLAAADIDTVVDGVARELQPLADSVALLRRLHEAGRSLYFLSNMPAPVAEQVRAANPFLAWFRDGVFSSGVQLAKPDPAIYALAAGRFGAAPGELLFIDDHLPNVHAAQAQGWQAFQFTGARQAEEQLHQRGLLP